MTERMTERTFAAAPVTVAALLGLAAGAGALAGLESSLPGRFLLLVLALGAGVEGLRLLLQRPTLRVSEAGLEVLVGWRRERIPWAVLEQVSRQDRRRRGAAARWLELDLGDRLVTVSAYRLGVPVSEVVAAIAACRNTSISP
jgi:hypothetical protein